MEAIPRHVALEQALAVARAAGASEEVMTNLANEASAAKQDAAAQRPLGARLDSARAKAEKAEARLAAANDALVAAKTRQEEAQKAVAAAQAELTELRAQSQACGMTTGPIISEARALLFALESSHIVDTVQGQVPEAILTRMHALRVAVETDDPEPTPDMTLEDDTEAVTPSQETVLASQTTTAATEQLGRSLAVAAAVPLAAAHSRGFGPH